MDYVSERNSILKTDAILAKENLIKFRNDIRYYHADSNDTGISIVESIDELLRYIDIFKKEELQ